MVKQKRGEGQKSQEALLEIFTSAKVSLAFLAT